MDNKFLILLLQIINGNGNISPLLKLGLTYSQIAEYTDYAIEKRYISTKYKTLKLTKFGIDKIGKINKELYINNSNKWISPQEEYRIEKISIEEIYIPRKIKRNY
ncbi:MAG: hypothetical protein WC139_13165 [Candidatus Kapaibacterium sp.]